jgi:hypothetical protein
MHDDLFINTARAAQILGRSVRTLERWRGTGYGPEYCKFGRGVMYRLSDVLAWAEGKNYRSTSGYHGGPHSIGLIGFGR